MVTAATKIANTMLNDVPDFDGASSTTSPTTIITSRPPSNLAHLRLNFGDYAHLTVDTLPYNSMKPHTIPCIALRPLPTPKALTTSWTFALVAAMAAPGSAYLSLTMLLLLFTNWLETKNSLIEMMVPFSS